MRGGKAYVIGDTLVHIAIRRENIEIIQFLLNYSPNFTLKNESNNDCWDELKLKQQTNNKMCEKYETLITRHITQRYEMLNQSVTKYCRNDDIFDYSYISRLIFDFENTYRKDPKFFQMSSMIAKINKQK